MKIASGFDPRRSEATREDFNRVLLSKISDALTEKQEDQFIGNLLQGMRRDGSIEAMGVARWAKWVLSKTP
jgi:ATP-dependent DNA helicase RecG